MAVVIGNLPMIQPLFTKAVKKIGSTFASTRGSEGESHGMSLKDMVRSRNPRTANALSISSSAEEIIDSRYKNSTKNNDGIHVVSETTVNTESLHENETKSEIARSHCVVSA